jgi:predicted RND superfamily exporter protein
VIGGLITSTMLSLLVVPAVFTYVDNIEHWFARQAKRLRHHPHHPVKDTEETAAE